MTMRSPTRSATRPHRRSVGTEPRKLAARTIPVCVNVSSKSRRMAGAMAGRPSPAAAYAACATTPADRTVHLYLGRGAGVELTQLLDLLGVGTMPVGAGNLEHDGEMLHLRMGEKDAQAPGH